MQCVVPENIHTPPLPASPLPHGGQRQFREEGCPKGDNFQGGGAGGCLQRFFSGGLSKIGELLMNNGFLMLSKLSVILLLPVFQNKYYCLH